MTKVNFNHEPLVYIAEDLKNGSNIVATNPFYPQTNLTNTRTRLDIFLCI